MKKLDYILRTWRYRKVKPYIQEGSAVLDIGGFDASFLRYIYDRIARGVCIDPFIEERKEGKIESIRLRIREKLPLADSSFDVVTMIAVYEHLGDLREPVATEIFRVLRDGGIALLTVPGGAVDKLLKVLLKMRLIDGMSTFEEHSAFNCRDTIGIFEARGFNLVRWSKFQLGLNNLFIFQKV